MHVTVGCVAGGRGLRVPSARGVAVPDGPDDVLGVHPAGILHPGATMDHQPFTAFACGLTAFLSAFTAFACGSTAFVGS